MLGYNDIDAILYYTLENYKDYKNIIKLANYDLKTVKDINLKIERTPVLLKMELRKLFDEMYQDLMIDLVNEFGELHMKFWNVEIVKFYVLGLYKVTEEFKNRAQYVEY